LFVAIIDIRNAMIIENIAGFFIIDKKAKVNTNEPVNQNINCKILFILT